jgi:hypothetical protein
MLRPIYMLSDVNLTSQSPVWGHILDGPARLCFRFPPRAFPRIRVRGITGVTLKSCCLRCSASTCCPHLVSTVTGVDRRLGCGPVTHLVRGGPSSGLAGLGRTGLGESSLPVPLGLGPAILPARPHRRLGRTGHSLARLAALGSCRRRLSRALAPAYPESLLASRCDREQPTSERLQAATPWQPAADSSEPVLMRAKVPRAGGSRPAASRTCPG